MSSYDDGEDEPDVYYKLGETYLIASAVTRTLVVLAMAGTSVYGFAKLSGLVPRSVGIGILLVAVVWAYFWAVGRRVTK